MKDVVVDMSWRLTEAELKAWLDRLVERGKLVVAPVEEGPA